MLAVTKDGWYTPQEIPQMSDGQAEVFGACQREAGCARGIPLEFSDCSLKFNPALIAE